MFDFTISPNNSQKEFVAACKKIEEQFPQAVKSSVVTDVDGTTIQKYTIKDKNIIVYDDYYIGAVYVKSDMNLSEIFN